MDKELFIIKEKLKDKKPTAIGVKSAYSIFMPLIKQKGKIHLLFEKRSMNLRNQPGEISFPGGKIEKGESPRDAAIRETCEELLIKKTDLTIISKGDFLVNPNLAIIYSFIGTINLDFASINASKDEVESIFTVPLEFFINNKAKTYKMKVDVKRDESFPYDLIPGGKNYKWKRGLEEVNFYIYENHVIWGFTAKMVRQFIENVF